MPQAQPIRAARGTRDILPAERAAWARVEVAAHLAATRFGYEEIETPVLEPVELIERGVGDATDVVQKELFRLQPRSDDAQQLVLRPEGTAGTVRAYFEGGMNHGARPARLYMLGSMFRYDRPQKGRYRQFHQFNVEAIGDPSAALDAEIIELAWVWLADLGLKSTSLQLNSIGDGTCRPGYLEALKAYYRPLADKLHPDCRRRLETNPLRLLDCKVEQCQPYKAAAPKITDHLCAECRAAFEQVRRLLEAAGIEYSLDPFLVRGLDYYVRTAFEVQHSSLGGAQNSLLGGGRYDGLAATIGYPATPGVGFAAGLERILEVMAEEGEEVLARPAAELLVLPDGAGLAVAGAQVARIARQAVSCAVDYSDRSLKAKMRTANRAGVRWVALFNAGEAERRVVQLKEMTTGEQSETPWEELPAKLVPL